MKRLTLGSAPPASHQKWTALCGRAFSTQMEGCVRRRRSFCRPCPLQHFPAWPTGKKHYPDKSICPRQIEEMVGLQLVGTHAVLLATMHAQGNCVGSPGKSSNPGLTFGALHESKMFFHHQSRGVIVHERLLEAQEGLSKNAHAGAGTMPPESHYVHFIKPKPLVHLEQVKLKKHGACIACPEASRTAHSHPVPVYFHSPEATFMLPRRESGGAVLALAAAAFLLPPAAGGRGVPGMAQVAAGLAAGQAAVLRQGAHGICASLAPGAALSEQEEGGWAAPSPSTVCSETGCSGFKRDPAARAKP